MSVDIEIETGSNLVSVPVHLNGSGPYRLHLDTGASTTTLTERLARNLGLSTYKGSRSQARGLGGGIPVEYALVDTLRVGEMDLGSQEVYVLDLDKVMRRSGGTDGVLGHSTLKDYMLGLNYRERRLELAHPEGPKGALTVAEQEWADFEYAEDSHLVTMPTTINGSGPFPLVVDTGAGSTVLTPKLVETLGIDTSDVPGIARGLGGDTKLKMAQLQMIEVNQVGVEQLQAAVVDLSKVSPKGSLIEYGILGYNFLNRFAMTLDYPKGRFSLRPLDSL